MDIKFVSATENDWDKVVEIELTQANNPFYAALKDNDEARKYLGNSVIFFIYVGGNLAGHVSYELHDKEVEINGLVIKDEFRGNNLGFQAIQKVLDDFEDKNLEKAWLVTHPMNTGAIMIYLRAGFAISGWLDNFFGDGQPRIKLEKSL